MYTIVTKEGELVAREVPWGKLQLLLGRDEDGNPFAFDTNGGPVLYHEPRVAFYGRKRRHLCYGLVETSIILAELKREVYRSVPTSSANFTISRVRYSNERGSGRYWEHNVTVCDAYAVTDRPAQEATISPHQTARARVIKFHRKPQLHREVASDLSRAA